MWILQLGHMTNTQLAVAYNYLYHYIVVLYMLIELDAYTQLITILCRRQRCKYMYVVMLTCRCSWWRSAIQRFYHARYCATVARKVVADQCVENRWRHRLAREEQTAASETHVRLVTLHCRVVICNTCTLSEWLMRQSSQFIRLAYMQAQTKLY